MENKGPCEYLDKLDIMITLLQMCILTRLVQRHSIINYDGIRLKVCLACKYFLPNRAINSTSGLSHFVWRIEFREAHLRVIAIPLYGQYFFRDVSRFLILQNNQLTTIAVLIIIPHEEL